MLHDCWCLGSSVEAFILYSPSRTILLGPKIQIERLGNESRSIKQAIQIFNPAFLSSVFSF